MRSRLQLFSFIFIIAFIGVLMLYLVPLPIPKPRLMLPLLVLLGVFSAGLLSIFLLYPVDRDERLNQLHLMGEHGLRKTDANSHTYFVDHPPLVDGSPDMKNLRFFWECDGREVETILPVDRVSLRVDVRASASVEFCFCEAQAGKCGMLAGLAKDPNWWLAESRVKETGFNFALIWVSPKELEGEIFLNREVKYF